MKLAVAYKSVTIGRYTAPDGSEYERCVALPSGLPASRLALLVRAAQWVDDTMLRWLLALPIYDIRFEVRLAGNIIHRTGNPFWCGTRSNRGDGTLMPLVEATATFVDEKGKRTRPKPCRTCFAQGLLVGTAPAGRVSLTPLPDGW